MMPNKKIVKLTKGQYYLFCNGICVTYGDEDWVKTKAKNYGLHEVALAIETMEKTGDDVADFGMFGSFITTQDFFKTDLGFKKN
jgi:hypothetical protein